MGTHPIFESDFDCLTDQSKMGKISTNPKSLESRERKATAAADSKAAKVKAKEDAFWHDDDKTKDKKDQRANDAVDKREAELARKKANKEAYEEEMATLTSKPKKKKGNENANKVTRAMILQAQMAQMEKGKKKKSNKNVIVPEPEPAVPIEENLNKLDIHDGAQTVDEAIDMLTSSSGSKQDRHPEKRLKATFAKFEEERYESVKSENPSLKRSQLKEIIWKEWQKSPQNPMNQPT